MTNKTVRPIMTVEARDALGNFHASTGFESRSESIVAIGMLNKDRHMLQGEIESLRVERSHLKCRESILIRDREMYKLMSTISIAALFALLMVTIFTAS